ncbi:GGDEF domain-containing protein, partial [Actinosynnema sp. NPDC050436]|uniref:GGDEF domain-containing protein n=1 Tax=Actinosynnema sp. NPDC050436 TaxID=3155659 RepID=UPI0034000491
MLRVVLMRLSALISHLTAERDRYLAEVIGYQAELEQVRRGLSNARRERGRAESQLAQAKEERERASILTELLQDKITRLERNARQSDGSPRILPNDGEVVLRSNLPSAEEILLDTSTGLDRLQRIIDAQDDELVVLESTAVDFSGSPVTFQTPLAVVLDEISRAADFLREVKSGAPGGFADEDTWHRVAERIREQLNANRVVLRLRIDPQSPMVSIVAGKPLPPNSDNPGRLREDPLLQLPGSKVRHFRTVDADEAVSEALARRNTREALVAPLREATQLLGAVEVHDLTGRERSFDKAHIDLLSASASHLTIVADNRRLLARLRHDAYHDPLTGLLNRPGFREAG